jgi:hypothetical protein
MLLAVDTAVVVLANVLPLTDDTDFKTIETAVAYNAAGMSLKWNFVTTAGIASQTAVTPTTGGVYDWTHLGGGMYSIEIPASDGASINNDTEGYGWFTGVATGVLLWGSPIYTFGPANSVNSLVAGSDSLDVNLASTGLDALSTNGPTSERPANFREWLMWICRRFGNRHKADIANGQLIVFEDGDVEPMSVQTLTQVATYQEVGTLSSTETGT